MQEKLTTNLATPLNEHELRFYKKLFKYNINITVSSLTKKLADSQLTSGINLINLSDVTPRRKNTNALNALFDDTVKFCPAEYITERIRLLHIVMLNQPEKIRKLLAERCIALMLAIIDKICDGNNLRTNTAEAINSDSAMSENLQTTLRTALTDAILYNYSEETVREDLKTHLLLKFYELANIVKNTKQAWDPLSIMDTIIDREKNEALIYLNVMSKTSYASDSSDNDKTDLGDYSEELLQNHDQVWEATKNVLKNTFPTHPDYRHIALGMAGSGMLYMLSNLEPLFYTIPLLAGISASFIKPVSTTIEIPNTEVIQRKQQKLSQGYRLVKTEVTLEGKKKEIFTRFHSETPTFIEEDSAEKETSHHLTKTKPFTPTSKAQRIIQANNAEKTGHKIKIQKHKDVKLPGPDSPHIHTIKDYPNAVIYCNPDKFYAADQKPNFTIPPATLSKFSEKSFTIHPSGGCQVFFLDEQKAKLLPDKTNHGKSSHTLKIKPGNCAERSWGKNLGKYGFFIDRDGREQEVAAYEAHAITVKHEKLKK